MGVPKYLISDALVCCIAQRLVRLLCPNCKEKYNSSNSESELLNIDKSIELFKPKGCSCCNNTGYAGRTVVYEMIHLNANHKKIISCENGVDGLREYCSKTNFISIPENCKKLLFSGKTSYEELVRLII
jgi:type IV pilus assembly protein PilB